MMKKNFYCTIVLLFLCGCENFTSYDNSFDYSIDQKMDCFCPQGGKWVRLFVKEDIIEGAVDLSDNSQLSREQRMYYKTIKGLFEEIALRDTSTFYVTVTMEPAGNYPSYIYFNPKPEVNGDTVLIISDAQLSYTTKNYFEPGKTLF